MHVMGKWRFAWMLMVFLGPNTATAQIPQLRSVQTPSIGNITTIRYVVVTPQTDYSYTHVVDQNGTNINITISEHRGSGGFTAIGFETNTATIAGLNPGEYQLIFHRDNSFLSFSAGPFHTQNFVVPDLDSKALSISRGNDVALISVRGITNGLYTVDCANKLGEWTPLISTNLNTNQFPFTVTNSISAPAQFYRVGIQTTNAIP